MQGAAKKNNFFRECTWLAVI